MQTLSNKTDVRNDAASPASTSKSARGIALAAAVAFAAILLCWFKFDHHVPDADEAGHILNSLSYAALFRHPKLFNADFWHKMITVNQFYPPVAYISSGFLKLLLGPGRTVDIINLAFFNLILSLSIYGTTRLLTGSVVTGLLAMVFVNLYPETAYLSHMFWLDYPLTAMVSLGLFALVYWSKKQTWARTLACGAILGLACMTKQIAATYLVLPGAYFFAVTLKDFIGSHSARSKSLGPLLQLVVIALLTAVIGLPWVQANAAATQALMSDCAAHVGKVTVWQAFPKNLAYYAAALPKMMTPYLLALFGCAALFLLVKLARREAGAANIYPVLLSMVGGIMMACTLTWIFPRPQYAAPALVASAIVTAYMTGQMLESRKRGYVASAVTLVAAAALQFISLQFTPYPLSGAALANLGPAMGGTRENPLASLDWGQEWSLRFVNDCDKGHQVYLNILSNSPHINAHTFELLAHELKVNVTPTTSRVYSITGDRTEFSPKQALYYQWYLLNTNNDGHPFEDAQSQANSLHLEDFVRNSGKFALMAEKRLPDMSIMYLYRQKP
jgi:4-amino-4-deoxy-L-arabinose transferase-like glycosyltransferase